ncbi:MAG: MarR family winged helix-turn-helix transcriptional regulator [Jiangellaceae bacterium]
MAGGVINTSQQIGGRVGSRRAALDMLATARTDALVQKAGSIPGMVPRCGTGQVLSPSAPFLLEVQRCLVERRADPADGRGVLVRLTPRGKATIDGGLEAHVANEERLLRALTAAERRTLDDLLRKLLVDLEPSQHASDGDGADPRPRSSSPGPPAE